jgi:hypothetical protein
MRVTAIFLVTFLFSLTSFAQEPAIQDFSTLDTYDMPVPEREPAAKGSASAQKKAEEPPSPEIMDLNKELNQLEAKQNDKQNDDKQNDKSSSGAPSGARARKDSVIKTISDNYPELKSCYQQGLKKDASLKGKVVMGWSIDPQGKVADAEIQTSQLNNKEVEKCMTDKLSKWHFPRQARLSGNKDRMTYTFQFMSETE